MTVSSHPRIPVSLYIVNGIRDAGDRYPTNISSGHYIRPHRLYFWITSLMS